MPSVVARSARRASLSDRSSRSAGRLSSTRPHETRRTVWFPSSRWDHLRSAKEQAVIKRPSERPTRNPLRSSGTARSARRKATVVSATEACTNSARIPAPSGATGANRAAAAWAGVATTTASATTAPLSAVPTAQPSGTRLRDTTGVFRWTRSPRRPARAATSRPIPSRGALNTGAVGSTDRWVARSEPSRPSPDRAAASS